MRRDWPKEGEKEGHKTKKSFIDVENSEKILGFILCIASVNRSQKIPEPRASNKLLSLPLLIKNCHVCTHPVWKFYKHMLMLPSMFIQQSYGL